MALIEYRVESGVGIVELNNPPANAYTLESLKQLDETIVKARFDTGVHVLVVRGAGEKFFSAGADINMLSRESNEFRNHFALFGHETLARLENTPKLVIAAINGHCVGGGLEIAMACDIRIAADDAKLSTAFTRIGMHPGMAATYLLTRLVGTARAAELFFTAKAIDAAEAARIGLVNRTVPGDRLLAEAQALASEIAANAPIAIGMVKRAIYLAERADLDTMLEYEGLAQPITMGTRDLLEGLQAAKDKRDPSFSG
ncbi:MAG TPA: enoyl-CoA hydratase/isomerase family protein [Gammaproteobacteria bacterium]|nr:enoyl-CoA hydratase/isomerase family protein [Gammaproteobacteria bacterium]